MARCKRFNKKPVMAFFGQYGSILNVGQFIAENIYNIDETGLTTVYKTSTILAQKGEYQVRNVTNAKRGIYTTYTCSINITGEFVSHMIIFKRKTMVDDIRETEYVVRMFGKRMTSDDIIYRIVWTFYKVSEIAKITRVSSTPHLSRSFATYEEHWCDILAREYEISMISLPVLSTQVASTR